MCKSGFYVNVSSLVQSTGADVSAATQHLMQTFVSTDCC